MMTPKNSDYCNRKIEDDRKNEEETVSQLTLAQRESNDARMNKDKKNYSLTGLWKLNSRWIDPKRPNIYYIIESLNLPNINKELQFGTIKEYKIEVNVRQQNITTLNDTKIIYIEYLDLISNTVSIGIYDHHAEAKSRGKEAYVNTNLINEILSKKKINSDIVISNNDNIGKWTTKYIFNNDEGKIIDVDKNEIYLSRET